MIYLAIILLLGLVILVHEWGHFIAARRAGLPVARFSLGFGPALFKVMHRGTEFRLSWLPWGGYVLLDLDDLNDYYLVPARRRAVFFAGGPLANILLSWLLFGVMSATGSGLSWDAVVVRPAVQVAATLALMIQALLHLFTGSAQLSGLVGIVSQGAQYVGGDWIKGIRFAALISLNLAVFNLLPVPGLDGGKLLWLLLEKICPRSVRWLVPATLVGMALLVGLMLYVTVLDAIRIV